MFLHKLLTILVCIFALDSVAQALRKAQGMKNKHLRQFFSLANIAFLLLVTYESANLLRVMNII